LKVNIYRIIDVSFVDYPNHATMLIELGNDDSIEVETIFDDRYLNLVDSITICSGEPAMQPFSVIVICEMAKSHGKKVKLNSNCCDVQFIWYLYRHNLLNCLEIVPTTEYDDKFIENNINEIKRLCNDLEIIEVRK
jgi:hypothetical protein